MPKASTALTIDALIAPPQAWREAWEKVVRAESLQITQDSATTRWRNMNTIAGQARRALRLHTTMTAFNGVAGPLIIAATAWRVGAPATPGFGLALVNICGGLALWLYWSRQLNPVPPVVAPPGTTRESRVESLVLAGVRLQGIVLRDWLMRRAVLVTTGGLVIALALTVLLAARG